MAQNDQKKALAPILPTHIGLAIHKMQQFCVLAPSHVTPEDLTRPELWAHVGSRFQVGDELRVLAVDMSWRAECIVTYKLSANVRVHVLEVKELDKVDHKKASDWEKFEVKQRGPLKWCIVDKDTGENLFKEIPTQAEAYTQLEQHVKALST